MPNEKCLHPYRDRYGIERRCQKRKGHLGKHK